MAQQFYIKQNSLNPTLRVELINDGKYDFYKSKAFDYGIQNADITFSMWDENGIMRISNANCNLILDGKCDCDQRYVIEYPWKQKDVKHKGKYVGEFTNNFNNDLMAPNDSEYLSENLDENISGPDYIKGILKMPIEEQLEIFVI